MAQRGMKIAHDEKSTEVKTENKSIMEWALEHAITNKKTRKERVKALKKINVVRQHKAVTLPCELFGFSGKYDTQCTKYFDEKSLIKWRGMERHEKIPNRWQKQEWDSFIPWLRRKEASNACDFDKYVEHKWVISSDNKYFYVKHDGGYYQFEKKNENGRQM